MFQDMAQRNRLPLRQLVCLHEDVAMDRTLSSLLDLRQLRCETLDEELQPAGSVHAAEGCGDSQDKPRSHDTSRIAWARLRARVGEEFPMQCPSCGGDIRLIAFITEPGPIRKILTHLGEPLEPPSVSPARGPPTDWDELMQAHDDREVFQVSPDALPAINIHSL